MALPLPCLVFCLLYRLDVDVDVDIRPPRLRLDVMPMPLPSCDRVTWCAVMHRYVTSAGT